MLLCRPEQDSNLDRWSARQARWPLDHHTVRGFGIEWHNENDVPELCRKWDNLFEVPRKYFPLKAFKRKSFEWWCWPSQCDLTSKRLSWIRCLSCSCLNIKTEASNFKHENFRQFDRNGFKIQLHSKFGLIYAKHFSVPNCFAIKDAKNSHFNMAME